RSASRCARPASSCGIDAVSWRCAASSWSSRAARCSPRQKASSRSCRTPRATRSRRVWAGISRRGRRGWRKAARAPTSWRSDIVWQGKSMLMENEKIKITKDKETYLPTVYGKALDSRARNPILGDRFAAEALGKIDFDFDKIHVKGGEISLPV